MVFYSSQYHSRYTSPVSGPKMVCEEPLGCHEAQFDNDQLSPMPSLLQMRKLQPREAKFKANIQISPPYIEDSLGEQDGSSLVGCLTPASEKSEAKEVESCVQLGTYQ